MGAGFGRASEPTISVGRRRTPIPGGGVTRATPQSRRRGSRCSTCLLRRRRYESQLNIAGKTKTYSPIKDKDTYWGVDQTAIPSAPAPDPNSPDAKPKDTWQYARVNPQEHFAELYAKAVHVPEKLHEDLVARPAAEASKARADVETQEHAIARLEASRYPNALKVAEMRTMLTALKNDAAIATRAEKQRGEQFSVMRNDVFHTDKAVAAASARLQAQKVSPEKLREFGQRAARASTPEQVEVLERESRP